ncbi:FHA domain-containing protein [Pseudenhygromyxa sp. WMMC2535]|uniref:adenylate/guanylate cyclase domain-containing protein n=1 Tax=Pseudenhygromyxa sp. WMMC2535 TaxID=2712867 RepID=UPI001551CB8E|nr:adenylate/guanylate cyclase domain-containing protein [Pseudenhygromyxa sp. WMMC2535]NVB37835.1 FHA domain-containing protein [Pseudenhygromyxa sp. WMMC2535]
MSAKLILLGETQIEYPLTAFNTLGRHPDNTIQVLDRIVSKEHARITLGPNGRWMIRDAGSLNGTMVNGERVGEGALNDGDQLQLGNTTFRFVESNPQHQTQQAAQNARVTMMPGQVQSEVRNRIDAGKRFLPVADIQDIATLKADYEKLRVAHELSQKLALDTDLDKLLQQIVDETFQIIRADRAVILLYDNDSDALTPAYVRQKRPDEQIQLSNTILEEVKRNKAAVLSSDAMVDERFKAAKSIIMQGIRSTMCVPLLVGDQLVGAFHVDSMLATGAFQDKDLLLFSGIATQAAVAIQNHRLAKKIEHEAATRAEFQRLLSPNLVEEIVSGALTLDQAGARREVTMLFADIRGFTSMSERHTPEEMVETLNAYFEFMVDVLFKHGGTLDKYVGDEIIGLFGAPVVQPDAPIRAVRCALDMLKALEEFNHTRANAGQEPVQIGIGLNTGPVIAGAIGSSQTLQYTVIGDAVNVSSRLCSVAKAGEIIISPTTMGHASDYIIAEQRRPVQVKGKSEPIQIWNVTGMRETPAGDAAPRRHHTAPFRTTQEPQ